MTEIQVTEVKFFNDDFLDLFLAELVEQSSNLIPIVGSYAPLQITVSSRLGWFYTILL